MATTKSMSMPTEKYMQTKWGKTMAFHEGDIEFDMATINVKMDEESVFVTSNDKITLEAAFDINIGKTEGIEETLETKNISMIAEDLVTFKVMGTRSTVEMDVDNSIFSLMQTRMEGSNKAPMALLAYEGPEEQEPPPPPPPPPPPEPEKPKKKGFWNTVAKVALCAVAVAAVAVVCVACASLAVTAIAAGGAVTAAAVGTIAAGVLGTVAMGAAAYTGGKAVAEIAMTDDVGQYARDTIGSVVKGRFTDKHTALGNLLTMMLYVVSPELALAGTSRDLTCDIINLEDTPWYVTALDALGFGLSAFGVYSKRPTKPISETAVKPTGEAQQKPNTSAAGGSENSRNINGQRTSRFHELTETEINSLKNDVKAIGADESVFKFNEGTQTGFVDGKNKINVKGDVLPDYNSTHPRDLMSERAVLAHEYYGHRVYDGTNVPQGSWNDEFRASYMAAKNTPNLSEQDRIYLILDAIERAREGGVPIKLNDFMRRTIYGY